MACIAMRILRTYVLSTWHISAARCYSMIAGQGVSQAFEDAVHLAHAIQEGGLTPQSLRAFEAKRISRMKEITAAEMVSTN